MATPTDEQYESFTLQIYGLTRAIARFQGGGTHISQLLPDLYAWGQDPSLPCRLDDQISPKHVHFALSEALSLFAAADWALGDISGRGDSWQEGVRDGHLIPALRCVRNAVHHDLAEPIDLSAFETGPMIRHEVITLRWSSIESDRKGRDAYDRLLIGEPIQITLQRGNVALMNGFLACIEEPVTAVPASTPAGGR